MTNVSLLLHRKLNVPLHVLHKIINKMYFKVAIALSLKKSVAHMFCNLESNHIILS